MNSLEEAKEIRQMVNFIWRDCVCKDKEAYQDLRNLLGRGRKNDFVFFGNKIVLFQPVIAHIALTLLEPGTKAHYYDLSNTIDGIKWIQNNQDLEKAVSLMTASDILEFCVSSKDWDEKEYCNPNVRMKKMKK